MAFKILNATYQITDDTSRKIDIPGSPYPAYIFPNSEILNANTHDEMITSDGMIYECVRGGSPSVAEWVLVCGLSLQPSHAEGRRNLTCEERAYAMKNVTPMAHAVSDPASGVGLHMEGIPVDRAEAGDMHAVGGIPDQEYYSTMMDDLPLIM